MTMGEKIKALRTEKGLTQPELAKQINTTKQAIFKYENGIVTNIPSDKIERLAELFDVSPAYLMGWEEKKSALPDDDSALNAMILERFLKLTPENRLALLEYLERLMRGQEGK